MKRLPKIGERVSYRGSSAVGACVGIVRDIYPSDIPAPGYDWDDENCRYVQEPFNPDRWQVGVEIEGDLPTPFVFLDTNRFCPTISEIEAND